MSGELFNMNTSHLINTATKVQRSTQDTHWYVVYTKARHERKVAENLMAKGIETYCPLKIQTKYWSDRKKRVEAPLFNSYLFVKLPAFSLKEVFSVPGVVRYVYWCGQPAIVREHDIAELKNWLNVFDHELIQVEHLEVNQAVKIGSGSFMNYFAKVQKKNGPYLDLLLEGLGVLLRVKTKDILLDKVVE